MLKQLTLILAILSSFSSDGSTADGVAVRVPVETFYRLAQTEAPLTGTLWLAPNNAEVASGRAVLIVGEAKGARRTAKTAFAAALRGAGFNVLALDIREKSSANHKALMEDIQSGVVFLKTDSRIEASRILIVGAGKAAKGAASYAAANKQMARIVDGLALLGLEDPSSLRDMQGIPTLLIDPLKNPADVCKIDCRAVFYKSKLGPELQKTLVEFFLRPHG